MLVYLRTNSFSLTYLFMLIHCPLTSPGLHRKTLVFLLGRSTSALQTLLICTLICGRFLFVYTLLSSNSCANKHVASIDIIDANVVNANITKLPLIIAEHNKASEVIRAANMKIKIYFFIIPFVFILFAVITFVLIVIVISKKKGAFLLPLASPV